MTWAFGPLKWRCPWKKCWKMYYYSECPDPSKYTIYCTRVLKRLMKVVTLAIFISLFYLPFFILPSSSCKKQWNKYTLLPSGGKAWFSIKGLDFVAIHQSLLGFGGGKTSFPFFPIFNEKRCSVVPSFLFFLASIKKKCPLRCHHQRQCNVNVNEEMYEILSNT